MKKGQCTAEQIVRILEQAAAAGSSVDEMCRQHGISRATFHSWRRQYPRMDKAIRCSLYDITQPHVHSDRLGWKEEAWRDKTQMAITRMC